MWNYLKLRTQYTLEGMVISVIRMFQPIVLILRKKNCDKFYVTTWRSSQTLGKNNLDVVLEVGVKVGEN